MITKFDSLYAGHVDMDDIGYGGTAVNSRTYPNEHLVTVLEKTRARASRNACTTFSAAPPCAAPPPMRPLMLCFAMKSSARGDALTTGCQHSTGSVFGRGTSVISESS